MTNPIPWQDLLGKALEGSHIGLLYRDEAQLAETASHYISEGLKRGEAVIVVATAAHWSALVAALTIRHNIDLADVMVKGQLRTVDAHVALSAVMADGMPQKHRFHETAGSLIERARKHFGAVRVYGEMFNILWQRGNRAAAACLEELWKDLSKRYSFSRLCPCQADERHADAYNAALEFLAAKHSHVLTRTSGRSVRGRPAGEPPDEPDKS